MAPSRAFHLKMHPPRRTLRRALLALCASTLGASAWAADCVSDTTYAMPGPANCTVPAGINTMTITVIGSSDGPAGVTFTPATSGGAGAPTERPARSP